MVVVSASVGGGKGRDAKRAKALQIKKQQMEARIQEQIESWFLKFDADGNNALDKEELRNLLTHLHPEKPADDAALENLMQMAGGASSIIPDGQQSISKEQCMKVRPASSRTCGLRRQGVPLTRDCDRAADRTKVQLLPQGQDTARRTLRHIRQGRCGIKPSQIA